MSLFLTDQHYDDDGVSYSGPRVALAFAIVGIVLGLLLGLWITSR